MEYIIFMGNLNIDMVREGLNICNVLIFLSYIQYPGTVMPQQIQYVQGGSTHTVVIGQGQMMSAQPGTVYIQGNTLFLLLLFFYDINWIKLSMNTMEGLLSHDKKLRTGVHFEFLSVKYFCD